MNGQEKKEEINEEEINEEEINEEEINEEEINKEEIDEELSKEGKKFRNPLQRMKKFKKERN